MNGMYFLKRITGGKAAGPVLAVFFCFLSLPFGYAQRGASIAFKETHFNLGDVPHKSKTDLWVVFTNAGDSPLVITNVSVSCGCVKVKPFKHPVLPGQTDSLQVVFDAKDKGAFYKKIYLKSNAVQRDTEIHLQGMVK